MLLSVSTSWRARRVIAAFGALLCLAAASVADGASLQYAYRFDTSRLHLTGTAAGMVVRGDDMQSTWEAESPEIPYEVLTFLVPRGMRAASVRVTEVGEVSIGEGVPLAAAKPILDTEGRALAPKPGAQQVPEGAAPTAAHITPRVAAELLGGGRLHGYQLVSVRVYPVRWDAGMRRITAIPRMDLEIELAPGAALPLERQRYSAAIEADARRTLERLVANPEAIDSYDRRIGARIEKTEGRGFAPTDAPSLEGSDVDYVIVTTDALAASWQVLADWKTRRGVPTVVRTVEWIQANYRRGSDQQENVRTFIKDAYAKWAVRYVLLAGDTDILPARYGYSGFGDPTERHIPCDAYFACLDGNWDLDGDHEFGEAAVSVSDPGDSTDFLAEVYTGRVPVSTTTEIAAYIAKVQAYENPAQTTWQNRALFMGEVLFPVNWDTSQAVSMDGASFCEEMISFMGGCMTTKRLYENHWDYPGSFPLTLAATLADMSTGYGFMNHIGHGYRYNMSVGDQSLQNFHVPGITNGDKRGVLYMLNCTATAFDFPCLAEAFIEAPGAAVAVLGASRAAYALPSRNYNRGFMQAAWQNGYQNLGEIFAQSRLPWTANAYFDTADHYTHLLYNFLGDPEMVMHTCTPGATVASYSGSIGLGLTNINVHVTVGGVARQNALVCIQKGTEEYEFALTNASGDAVIPFRAESAGSAQVTVSGQNMTMHLGSINVSNAGVAYLSVQSLSVNDDISGTSEGNADGVIDAGETLEQTPVLVNSGALASGAFTGKLRIASPWVTMVDSVYSGSSVNPGANTSLTNQVAYSIATTTPDGTVLPLQFVTTAGTTWTDVVNRVVHAPRMQLALLDVEDPGPGGNNDGIIQAGETFNLAVYYKNFGTGAADGCTGQLFTADPHVIVTTSNVSFGRINPMQQVTSAVRFRLQETVLEENTITLVLTDSYGRNTVSNITLRGPATPGAPTLDASTGANVIIATWTPSIDLDLAGYLVYRSLAPGGPWTRITPDRLGRISYVRDTGLSPSTRYYYHLTSVDASGNESSPSTVASINTNPAQLNGWPIGLGSSSSCSPAVGDLTGDGSKEILAGNDHLYGWNWSGIELRDDDGDPQTWGIFSEEVATVTGAVAMGEIDLGSPGFEAFVTVWDDSNKAFVVKGNGDFVTGWPRNPDFTTPQKGYWADMALMDLDGDRRCEIFAPAKNGNLYAWRWNGAPLGAQAAFKTGFITNMRTSPSFANVDGDPQKEIIFGAPNGVLHIWNADGTNVGTFPKTAGTACLSNTAVGDINKDGILDVVFLTEGGAVNVYNTKTGNQLPGWPKALSIKGNPKTPSPALADFDFDGFLEIVVANNHATSTLSAVQIYNYQGNLLPGWPIIAGGHESESSPIVADVSGDGIPDILFGNQGGLMYGWDKNGIPIAGFPLTVGDWIRSVPFADDVDNDGYIDLVLAGWDKNVYIWDFPAPFVKAAAQWPTVKHDAQRSGLYGYRIDQPTDAGEEPVVSAPPARAFLHQNTPNPFNPTTKIEYGVPASDAGGAVLVRLDIFDAGGRHVRTLVRGEEAPGVRSAIWDGRDDHGRRLSTGVYFSRLQVAGQTQTRKMLMLK